ncbi:lipoprotein [Micromonospora sp. NPDC048830]|uniref:lipoprotein n=1 Tax=Micromonospora sp. NPDC048830 TaxID=3364257 RepID=UPI003720AF26
MPVGQSARDGTASPASSAAPSPTGGGPTATATAPTAAPGWLNDPAQAKAAGRVGAGGNCAIPGSFGRADKWSVVDVSKLGVVDHGLELRCEIDGEPAGVLGVMRVWVGPSGTDPRGALDTFVRSSTVAPQDVAYRDVKIGSSDGVEVSYRSDDHVTRAFAAPAPGRVVLVIWGGEADAFEAGLPAYVLARSTDAPAG